MVTFVNETDDMALDIFQGLNIDKIDKVMVFIFNTKNSLPEKTRRDAVNPTAVVWKSYV